MESNSYFGETMVHFFNYMNISNRTGVTIGNHDFDFGLKNMSHQFNLSNFPHLAANIYNKTDNTYWNFTKTFPNYIFQVGNLKVGVIGLTTTQTPQTTAGTDIDDLLFKEYVNITIEQSQILRNQGADIVLLDSHIGVRCRIGNETANEILKIRNKSSKQDTNCTENDELFEFLQQIPPETLDGVIAGHKHRIVHHWINDIPVVVSEKNARFFNVLYLTYDHVKKKVLRNLTKIEGPIPICETVPNNEHSCFFSPEKTFEENITLNPISFHNKLIVENQGLLDFLDPYLQRAEELKLENIAYIANPMKRSNYEESELGNFVADVLKNHTNSDIVLLNRGEIRCDWLPGNFSYYDLFETFPFEDIIVTYEVTGEELIKIVKKLQEGDWSFYLSSGLKQHVCNNPNYLINVTLENDKNIENNQIYTVATSRFMVLGGDDFSEVLKFYTPRNLVYYKGIREVVGQYLRNSKVLNEDGKKFIDPMNRRLIVHECQIK